MPLVGVTPPQSRSRERAIPALKQTRAGEFCNLLGLRLRACARARNRASTFSRLKIQDASIQRRVHANYFGYGCTRARDVPCVARYLSVAVANTITLLLRDRKRCTFPRWASEASAPRIKWMREKSARVRPVLTKGSSNRTMNPGTQDL